MNSGVALVSVDARSALVIPARKIEMIAPRVPPHASDSLAFDTYLDLSSLFCPKSSILGKTDLPSIISVNSLNRSTTSPSSPNP
jgi:hypothetical protein